MGQVDLPGEGQPARPARARAPGGFFCAQWPARRASPLRAPRAPGRWPSRRRLGAALRARGRLEEPLHPPQPGGPWRCPSRPPPATWSLRGRGGPLPRPSAWVGPQRGPLDGGPGRAPPRAGAERAPPATPGRSPPLEAQVRAAGRSRAPPAAPSRPGRGDALQAQAGGSAWDPIGS